MMSKLVIRAKRVNNSLITSILLYGMCRSIAVRCFYILQILMSVSSSLLVTQMPHVPTHLGHTHVPAMTDTLETEGTALVSMCCYLVDYE